MRRIVGFLSAVAACGWFAAVFAAPSAAGQIDIGLLRPRVWPEGVVGPVMGTLVLAVVAWRVVTWRLARRRKTRTDARD